MNKEPNEKAVSADQTKINNGELQQLGVEEFLNERKKLVRISVLNFIFWYNSASVTTSYFFHISMF